MFPATVRTVLLSLVSSVSLAAHAQDVQTLDRITIPGPILVDPWKSCNNYQELQNTLKGDETFIATGFSLKCDWRNSDVQPSVLITNNRNVYFAPGSKIFYCTAGGAAGSQTLWQNSLPAGASMSVFVPFGSGNTCIAKGVMFSLRNPPH